MLGANQVSSDTPIEVRKISKDLRKSIDRERYQELVGKLICLSYIRLNIAFPVNLVCQHTSPKRSYLEKVYKILKYLKVSLDRDLFFPKI